MPRFSLAHCSAIITGASSGLGAEFARQLAPQARSLCLVARRQPELENLKAELTSRHPQLQVHLVIADVSSESDRHRLVQEIERLQPPPNLLINNAGVGDYGAFQAAEADRIAALLHVNITGLVLLTHAIIPLLQRPAGIINVSSLAASLFMPELAIYAASKSFVSSFSEALHLELKPHGITVTAVCPGPTPTNFSKNAKRTSGEDTNRSGQGLLRQPPQKVVALGLEAVGKGRPSIHPGWPVAIAATLFRILPRPILRYFMAKRMQPGH
jgi:uncharacterized protein